MKYEQELSVNCFEFEENLTDYLDNALPRERRQAFAAHALACPLCHSLLNEVKDALAACREIAVPKTPLTPLEARILSATMPETAMACDFFEEYLTDYLDGFLPAPLFHRWERHAVLCQNCSDLPGEVVRSIALCYAVKLEEKPVPLGLNDKILAATIEKEKIAPVKIPFKRRLDEWLDSLKIPFAVPQFASVAFMMAIAFFVFSQTVSADGSIGGMYQKSVELAAQTYNQSANMWEQKNEPNPNVSQPIEGNFVKEDK